MNTSYSLIPILLNAQLLLFSVTLPQANIIVSRHVSDLIMWIGYKQTLAKFVYTSKVTDVIEYARPSTHNYD